MTREGGSINKVWKRVYCVLDSEFLYYFESDASKKAKGVVVLRKYASVEAITDTSSTAKHKYLLRISGTKEGADSNSNSNSSPTSLPTLTFAAAKQSERDDWVECVRSVLFALSNVKARYGVRENLRHETTVYLKLTEARFSGENGDEKRDTFCLVYAGHKQVSRTATIYQSERPLYMEEFDFDGEKVKQLTLQVKQHTKHKKDKIIGQRKLNIETTESLQQQFVTSSNNSGALSSLPSDGEFWVKLYSVDTEIATGACLSVKWTKEVDQLEHNIISFQPLHAQEIPLKGDIYVQMMYETLCWKSNYAVLQKQKNKKLSAQMVWTNEKTSFLVLNPAVHAVSQIVIEVFRIVPPDERAANASQSAASSGQPGQGKEVTEFLGQIVVSPLDLVSENNGKEMVYDLREREVAEGGEKENAARLVGEIKVAVEKRTSSILPDKEYDPMFALLMEEEMALTKKLASVSQSKEKPVAEVSDCVFRIFFGFFFFFLDLSDVNLFYLAACCAYV
jgi:hypothetical protein